MAEVASQEPEDATGVSILEHHQGMAGVERAFAN
jgi:hypothetical protein